MLVGLVNTTPCSRMTFAYLMERHGFHIFLFEDFLYSDIDGADLTDEERKKFIQDNNSTNVIFGQMRQYMAPYSNVVIPHVTTIEQQEFIEKHGGLLIDVSYQQSFYHLLFSKSTSYFHDENQWPLLRSQNVSWTRQLVEKVTT